eukprot:523859_1
MAAKNKFDDIAIGFNALQTQLTQQLFRQEEIRDELQSLRKANLANVNCDDTQDHKEDTVSTTQKDSDYFTNNIMSSITFNQKDITKFADVIFEIYNDETKSTVRFYGIRALFAMHSSVFETILYNDTRSDKRQTIIISDKYITSSSFKTLAHLCYGLCNMTQCITNDNALHMLYIAHKYNIAPLTEFCLNHVINDMILMKIQHIQINVLCDVLNQTIEQNLYHIFDKIVQRTVIAKCIELNTLLSLKQQYLLHHLSLKAFTQLLFECDVKHTITAEEQWALCLQWSKMKAKGSTDYKHWMNQFKDNMNYNAMSGQFFLKHVQIHNILDEKELIVIMQQFLNNDDNKEQKQSEFDGFNEYNASYSKVLKYDKRAEIMTKGHGGCQWIWFGCNKGWVTGKHVFKVKCDGLSAHDSGNIIGIIGATDYGLIKHIWDTNECIYDLDFDEDSDEEERGEGEIVSMSYDWNGHLYKDDEMLVNTQNPWSVNDEVSIILDLDEKYLRFLKNGENIIKDIDIVLADDLVWFPLLQCCACKGHRYSANFD